MMTISQVIPRLIPLALLAAVVATLCDANHVQTNTLVYPYPFIAGQAPWVFPGFLIAFFSMGFLYFLLANAFAKHAQQSAQKGSAQALIETMTTFAFCYLISGFGSEQPALLAWIFYGTFLLRFAFTYEKAWLLIVAIILAIGGVFAEGLLSSFGLVAYQVQEIYYVPLWLGGLYMHGAFALREGMRFFVYR